MTRGEAVDRMRELQRDRDHEAAHGRADAVLCELLRDLGFGDVVDEYLKLQRWCA